MSQNNTSKVRRSALYMPCSVEKMLVKATGLDADVLLFDLEDAVAPTAKVEARNNIVKALNTHDYGYRERIVRVNHVDTDWGYDDLKALADADFDGVLLPKVESTEQINQAVAVLGRDLPVWVMIETPLGVINADLIASHPLVSVLVLGTNDLAKELKVTQSAERQEFLYTFSKCILAARAYGCDVIDGVFNALDDETGLEQVCEQGKALGFDGKTLIHPKQLGSANGVFSPSDEEIAQAEAISKAWQDSQDKGVIVVNGKLVEALHVEQAQKVLAMAALIQER